MFPTPPIPPLLSLIAARSMRQSKAVRQTQEQVQVFTASQLSPPLLLLLSVTSKTHQNPQELPATEMHRLLLLLRRGGAREAPSPSLTVPDTTVCAASGKAALSGGRCACAVPTRTCAQHQPHQQSLHIARLAADFVQATRKGLRMRRRGESNCSLMTYL